MALSTFALLQDPKALPAIGTFEREGPDEKAKGARNLYFTLPEGRVILTIWRKKLHCVTYQTPARTEKAALQRNAFLFDRYGDGRAWTEVLDNGFGKSYWRADQEVFALWSYAMDFNTFGTKAFHAVMRG